MSDKSLEQSLLNAADQMEKTASDIEDKKTQEDKDAEAKAQTDKLEKVASVKKDLGIEEDSLAEKVASADPEVVKYIKSLNRTPVDTMGGTGEDEGLDKTASVSGESDPLLDFCSTPA